MGHWQDNEWYESYRRHQKREDNKNKEITKEELQATRKARIEEQKSIIRQRVRNRLAIDSMTAWIRVDGQLFPEVIRWAQHPDRDFTVNWIESENETEISW
jgi:hypothetical protein